MKINLNKFKISEKQKSRYFMYIFLSIAYLTGLGIVQTYAYGDLELCQANPDLVHSSMFINAVVDR